MIKRWFITATDTDAGKTVASCTLLRAAQLAGWRTAGYKPVAAGCELTADGLRNSDALALQRHSSLPLSYQQVNPLALGAATSPHIASAEQGQRIEPDQLTRGLRLLEQQANWIVVEGAGGWYTPLNEQHTFADWLRQHPLPVILVVAMKLGCISHALLTAKAIQADGLTLAGWIANQIQPPGQYYRQYLATLISRINAPLIGEIPYYPDLLLLSQKQSSADLFASSPDHLAHWQADPLANCLSLEALG